MPNIFESAVDKIAEGALQSQCQAMAQGFVRSGLLDPKDAPAMTAGLKLLASVFMANLAKGQG